MQIAQGAVPMARPLFEKWKPLITKHAQRPHTEIEFRFGRKAGKGFDTNVGKETFDTVLKAMQKYDGWEDTHKTVSTMYYFEGSKRLTINEETDEQVGHIKKRVLVDDFDLEKSPFDVRLGISTEEPFEYDGDETSTEQKTKERWSFVRKNLSIDLSIVKGTPDDPDSDEDTTYQIEMEIVKPAELKDDKDLYNIIHKVFDLLKCV